MTEEWLRVMLMVNSPESLRVFDHLMQEVILLTLIHQLLRLGELTYDLRGLRRIEAALQWVH